jgi:thioredoxin reductase
MTLKKYDLIIVGAGPAGIFLCIELKRLNSNMNILLVKSVQNASRFAK